MTVPRTVASEGEVRNYLDGEWRAASGADGQDVVDPATGERLAYVPFTDADVHKTHSVL